MTDQDLRAAAERLAKGDIHANYSHVALSVQHAIADGIRLAEAYLAEHPEDDGEPVTEEWNVIPSIVKTRGDVRRLCKALGIELKGGS